MSAYGTKQTSISTLNMSALRGISDMTRTWRDVCFDPKRTFASPLLKRKYRENLVEHLLHDCIGSVLPSSEIVSLVHIVSVTLTFSRNLKGNASADALSSPRRMLVAQKSRLLTKGIFDGR
jgi:hypothetical protein